MKSYNENEHYTDGLPEIDAESRETLTPEKKKKERIAEPNEVLDLWNSLPNWKATGKRGAPINPSAINNLLPPSRMSLDLKIAINAKKKKYEPEEIERAIKAYASDVANRKKDQDYAGHRYSLYEFLTRKEVFERYVNR